MGSSRRRGAYNIPVAAIKLKAVNRCALSAHTRPLTRNLSNVETRASRALSAAARRRRTFSCAVSPAGPGCRAGCELNGGFEPRGNGFVEACGVVAVNRVASVADRGILKDRKKRTGATTNRNWLRCIYR